MHGIERRRLATGALAEFDHGHADAIAELGCPTRVAPRAWRDERERARRGRWVRSGSREGGGPPAGRARTVIGPGARTATLVAPLRSDRLS